jgi:hypothetical protein
VSDLLAECLTDRLCGRLPFDPQAANA